MTKRLYILTSLKFVSIICVTALLLMQCANASEVALKGISACENEDFESAANWFTQAAMFGDANAQFTIGLMHATGVGSQRDFSSSDRWFKNAAAEGQSNAKMMLEGIVNLESVSGKSDQFTACWNLIAGDGSEVFLAKEEVTESEEIEFRGIAWGSDFSEHSDEMEFVAERQNYLHWDIEVAKKQRFNEVYLPPLKAYKRKGDQMSIGSVNLERLHYVYLYEKFYGLMIHYDSSDTESNAIIGKALTIYLHSMNVKGHFASVGCSAVKCGADESFWSAPLRWFKERGYSENSTFLVSFGGSHDGCWSPFWANNVNMGCSVLDGLSKSESRLWTPVISVQYTPVRKIAEKERRMLEQNSKDRLEKQAKDAAKDF